MCGVSDFVMAICSRGLSKTWMCGVVAMAISDLYPYSEIVITSSTVNQANKVAEKILNEIIKKNSEVLLYKYNKEYIVKTQRDDGWTFENKLNGSTIRVLAALDSSRGARATFILYEEARLIKNSIIQSVFRPMAHPRQAKFLENPIYGQNKRWLEDTKNVYISSACYRFEWLYTLWRKTFTNIFKDKETKYNIFAGDIYTSMANGLKTIGDFNRAKKTSTDDAFRMEDLNEFIGSSEDAFFNYQQFKEAQVLTQCFRPLTPEQVIMGDTVDFPDKEENEVRLVVADFAFTETKGANESDFTQFICMSGHWRKDRFERHIDYMETWPANDDDGAVQRLKELYWDYQADYVTPDARNGGENIIVQFSKPSPNESRGSNWLCRGFGMCDIPQYHVATKEKLDFYRSRAVDQDCIPCLIPFIGSASVNTAYWRSTKRALDRKMFKMLVSMQDKQDELENNGRYFQMTSEQLAEEVAPFGQGDMLVKEAVELKKEIKNDQIHLTAPRSGHRDRIVTCAMGMLIFDKIEDEWNKQATDNTEENIDEMQLVW